MFGALYGHVKDWTKSAILTHTLLLHLVSVWVDGRKHGIFTEISGISALHGERGQNWRGQASTEKMNTGNGTVGCMFC